MIRIGEGRFMVTVGGFPPSHVHASSETLAAAEARCEVVAAVPDLTMAVEILSLEMRLKGATWGFVWDVDIARDVVRLAMNGVNRVWPSDGGHEIITEPEENIRPSRVPKASFRLRLA